MRPRVRLPVGDGDTTAPQANSPRRTGGAGQAVWWPSQQRPACAPEGAQFAEVIASASSLLLAAVGDHPVTTASTRKHQATRPRRHSESSAVRQSSALSARSGPCHTGESARRTVFTDRRVAMPSVFTAGQMRVPSAAVIGQCLEHQHFRSGLDGRRGNYGCSHDRSGETERMRSTDMGNRPLTLPTCLLWQHVELSAYQRC